MFFQVGPHFFCIVDTLAHMWAHRRQDTHLCRLLLISRCSSNRQLAAVKKRSNEEESGKLANMNVNIARLKILFFKSALQIIYEEGNAFTMFVRHQGHTECKHNFVYMKSPQGIFKCIRTTLNPPLTPWRGPNPQVWNHNEGLILFDLQSLTQRGKEGSFSGTKFYSQSEIIPNRNLKDSIRHF